MSINSTGNTVPQDYFKAVEEVLGADLDKYLPKHQTLGTIMKNWIEKPGYPIITLSSEGDKLYKIEQVNFHSCYTTKIFYNLNVKLIYQICVFLSLDRL